ncbi:MAG TPA: rhomboid family intramembrane serine protease [Gemmatimonadales bacterium]|nr:rhomboid family intramembrane serine protease [Gemmatimonadales bacterium]
MTPRVAALVLINIAAYLLAPPGSPLWQAGTLVPAWLPLRPWTALTYAFLHGGFGHIFFNMLSLWIFGPAVEQRLGGRRFLWLYLSSALAGALASALIAPHAAVVGASGATFGVMLAFARYWPREIILVMGFIALEARVWVAVMTLMSLIGGMGVLRDNVAHFAHLGGFAGAWLFLALADRHSPAARWQRMVAPEKRPSGEADLARWRSINPELLHPVNREEFLRVMGKLQEGGITALNPDERAFLDRFAR